MAVAGLVGWVIAPGHRLLALPLLFAPGWGALRLVSVLDRNFGVLACALTLSPLVGGVLAQLAAAQDWGTARLGLALHMTSVTLCLLGRLRLAFYDRWVARQPPHPAPMPWWPANTAVCLLILLVSLAAALHVEPLGRPHLDDARTAVASRAVAWMSAGEEPLRAGHPLPASDLPAAATAALSAASGLHPLVTAQLLALAALAACLLFAAESISRLKGNHGGSRAMLALLLGLNPLAGVFLLGNLHGSRLSDALAPGFDPKITSAIAPFLQAAPLATTLAFVSMLHFASLSVMRRASTHVPRLILLAGFGLVLSGPRVALLLLPGWFLGLLFAHLACRDSPDNDPQLGGPSHRAGDPAILRSPFWRPALHLGVGLALGAWFVDMPPSSLAFSRTAAWGLLAAVGPACLLFVPGVRHLNASPGREAYFYVGMLLPVVTLGVLLNFTGDDGHLVARVLALLLAVPAANGAMKMLEVHGNRARLALGLLVVLALPGPLALFVDRARLERPLSVIAQGNLRHVDQEPARAEALRIVRDSAPRDAALLIDHASGVDDAHLEHLAARRPLVVDPNSTLNSRRAALLRDLIAGDGMALQTLRGLRGLAARELWAVHDGTSWPGFEPVNRVGDVRIERARAPHVVLVTVSGLRADRVEPEWMPQLRAAAERGLEFVNAITPTPDTLPGLATLLTGLDPVDHSLRTDQRTLSPELPHLASTYAERGYRTAALVALPEDTSLLSAFEIVHTDPAVRARELIDVALEQLAQADPRPLFMWVHLSDLELPYVLPEELSRELRDEHAFPRDGFVENVPFASASFPPATQQTYAGVELDVARGLRHYDALIGHLDTQLARLMISVSSQDLLVLTAPHGTSLDEHGAWFDHGRDLYEPSIHVPLLLLGAGMPRAERAELTALQDLSGLLLEGRVTQRDRVLLESRERPGLGAGRAYPPELDPDSRGAARRIWGERRADDKLILSRDPSHPLGPGGLRFDLGNDPDELRGAPAAASDLRRIETWMRRGQPPQPGETREQG
ncbi:MAG: hypothetical protein DHS20C15_21510 [Planctomycetota bacterium]|nr:MAG: hypothetical protein DHS20C15_21510 [Planctomycetota bacterium]